MVKTMSQKPTAWLFPGQGSQEIGMGRVLFQCDSNAESVFAIAEQMSGLPLRTVCQKGPESTLVQTNYLQPTIVALSVAYTDFLIRHRMSPKVVAGHSLGELSALYASGVLSKEDVLLLAAERGRLMSQSAQGGMMAVKDISFDRIHALIEQCKDGIVVPANFNAPSQLVLSGEEVALNSLQQQLASEGANCVRLNVQGAWHSPLVSNASEAFCEVINRVQFRAPHCDLYMGMTASFVSNPEEIRELLKHQICSPVRWFELIERIQALGIADYLEVGPGKVLRGLMRKILADANSYTISGVDNARFIKEVAASGAES